MPFVLVLLTFMSLHTHANGLELFSVIPNVQDENCDPITGAPKFTGLVDLLNMPQFKSCFDPEISPFFASGDIKNLMRDKVVCDCLNEKIQAAGDDHSAIYYGFYSDKTRNPFNDSASETKRRANKALANIRNGVMFQASILAEQRPELAGLYAQGTMVNALQAHESKIKETFQAEYIKKKEAASPSMSPEAKVALTAEAKEVTDYTIPEANVSLLSDTNVGGDVCITAREFLSFKQLPSDNNFFQDIALRGGFREQDWDYKHLENRMRELHAKRSLTEEESNEMGRLRARRKFIESNPLIKNLFAVSENNDSFFEGANIPPEAKAEILSNPAWKNIKKKKEELFKIIKGLTPSSACLTDQKNCLHDSIQENKVPRFLSKVGDFFANKDVAFLANIQGLKEVRESLSNIFDPTKPPRMPKGYRGLERVFMDRYGSGGAVTPSSCIGKQEYNQGCEETFQQYCPMLNTSYSELQASFGGEKGSLDDELFFESMGNWDADIKTNPDFRRFNDRICKDPRKTTRPGYPARATFQEFKQRHCQLVAKDPVCMINSTANIQKLRREFLNIYKMADVSDHPEFEAEEVAAFNQYTKEIKITPASESEVRMARENRPSTLRQISEVSNYVVGGDSRRKANSISRESDRAVTIPQSKVTALSQPIENPISGGANFDEGRGYVTPLANTSAVQEKAPSKLDPQNLTAEDKTKIDSAAEEELGALRRQLAETQASASQAGLESRMKMLEELLAQKDKSAAQYEKLISQLSSRLDSDRPNETTSTNENAAPAVRTKNSFTASSDYSVEDKTQRAPANINENPSYTTAGTSAGAASVSGSSGANAIASGRGASSFNSALLEAQESKSGTVQKSADGSIVLASDVNSPTLEAMGSAANPSSDYSLSVPASDYAGFEAQNMDTLQRYQEKFLKNMESNQPVRVFVRAENKDPLEFYVVKDGNKLFFKPIRKTGATLEALKQTVKKNP